MYEVESVDAEDLRKRLGWLLVTFVVPLAIILITFSIGGFTFFWGMILAFTLFGVFLPLSLVEG